MLCPLCQAQVSPDSRYCPSCGHELTGETQAAAPPNSPLPWAPYPGANTLTTPPGGEQPNRYPPYTPYPEQPATAQNGGATWPGTPPPPYAPGGQYPPSSPHRRGSGWQTAASVLAVGVVLVGMMFVWLSRGHHATPQVISTATTRVILATATPVPSACRKLSNFVGAGNATITPMYPQDIPFPPASLSYLSQTTHDGPYTFYFVQACSSGISADGVRSFFSQRLPPSGWPQSSYFPYHGDPTSDCGDPYCWQNSGPPAGYISLEQVQSVGNTAASTYLVRVGAYSG